MIDTPAGRLPVSAIATVEESDGPNQIGRENGRRRIVVYANTDGSRHGARDRATSARSIAATPLPAGYFVSLEGQFQAQEQATRLIVGLSLVSLAMMFLVLYSRYQSAVLAGVIMANIPLALIGSVVAMWIAGVTPVGRLDGRLHHAGRHRHAQRHPEGQPLHQPVQVRGRDASAGR